MNELTELMTLFAGFLATALTIVRLTLVQTKGLTERLVGLIEASLNKQDDNLARFRETFDKLNENVHENTLVVRQVAEWLHVATPSGGVS